MFNQKNNVRSKGRTRGTKHRKTSYKASKASRKRYAKR